MSLLSPAQLTAIQSLGRLGMTAAVDIYPTIFDTGLDTTDDPYGSELDYSTTASSTVSGWLVGTWATSRSPDVGDVNSATTYRLRLPVGTTVDVGWEVRISGNRYTVQDAGVDQTWPEWLTCIVRRLK